MSRQASPRPRLQRIAVVLNHPAQHFVTGFSILSEEADLDVEVMYWEVRESGYTDPSFGLDITWDIDLTATYPCWSPSGDSPAGRAFQCVRRLLDRRPDVILCYGWSTPIARLAIAVASARGIPILYYGDSTWQHSSRPRLRFLRNIVLRWLFSRPKSGALTTGRFNREFYLVNGMTPDRVHDGVCPVETQPFVDEADRRATTGGGRGGSGPAAAVSVVFAGKFVDRKAPSHLIDAAARLPASLPWHITFIGEGPLRQQLEQEVKSFGLGGRVTFSGFKNTSEMPAMLAAADVLVIPSTLDMRILVATEGMAAGAVPVVSSATAVWGAGDLVEHDVTGMVYPVGDIGALAGVLTELIADRDLRARLSSAAAARALEHDSDDFARLAAKALRVAPAPALSPLGSGL